MKPRSKVITHLLVAVVAIVLFVSPLCGQDQQPSPADNPNARQLNMLVLGDSILWGQGLTEPHKTTAQVKQWLKDNTNREVNEQVVAHSGAVIGAPQSPLNQPVPTDGEVSFALPTVNQELDRAQNLYPDPSQVDLVLLNGCINDVDVRNLLNAANSVDEIKRMTTERCGAPMQALLRRVMSSFPSAHAIFTGYFPIISERTPNSLLMTAVARMFYQPGRQSSGIKLKELHKRLIAVSRVWYQTSNETLSDDADKINAELSAKGSKQRVLFAEVPFPAEYSFNTRETHLWGFDASFLRKLLAILTLGRVTLKTNDERRNQRINSCNDFYERNPGESVAQKNERERRRMLCRYASLGHPNRKGATVYTEAICARLQALLKESGWLRPQPGTKPASVP